MRVLQVASELHPIAKTGGLADVVAALGVNLRARGVDVQIMLPAYPCFTGAGLEFRRKIRVRSLPGMGRLELRQAIEPGSGVPLWLVDCDHLFRHPGSFYDEPAGLEGELNGLRFGLLSWAAAEFVRAPRNRLASRLGAPP